MEKGIFKFKKFSCRHYSSSMRIGVDAVLLGAWADVSGSRILDIGTGCGVIALMCAQRNPEASVLAIDIDEASVIEASGNFADSPWPSRISAQLTDFLELSVDNRFDLIVSNPPYFNSGVDPKSSVRMQARHEGSLSPAALLQRGSRLLAPGGRIALVLPWLRTDEVLEEASQTGLSLRRRMDVRGSANALFKRSLLEFQAEPCESVVDTLTLEVAPNVPTEEHRNLCKNFYLYF